MFEPINLFKNATEGVIFDTDRYNLDQKAIEDVINLLRSIAEGNSGADNIAATSISGLAGETVMEILKSIKQYIDTHKESADHDGRYFTEAEISNIISDTLTTVANNLTAHVQSGDHDGRYYTETEVNSIVDTINNSISSVLSALNSHKTSSDHDGRYYTEDEINTITNTINNAIANISSALSTHKTSSDHDSRYYTETEMDGKLSALDGANINLNVAGITAKKVSPAIKEVNDRIANIITTPVSGAAATQEIVDARNSAVKGKTFGSLDERMEETETDIKGIKEPQMSVPADYTQFVISLPSSTVKGPMKCIVKGRTAAQLTATTDFAGKTAGSTTVNPNKLSFSDDSMNQSTTLLKPSEFAGEATDLGYGRLVSADNSNYSKVCAVSGRIPQFLVSFDMIRWYEDRYGKIPSTDQTTSGKVAWLKANFTNITAYPWAYGMANGINKVYADYYNASLNKWASALFAGWATNSASSPAKLTLQSTTPQDNIIDQNGFVNCIIYTDPVATNDKAILLTGHGLTAGYAVIENITRGNLYKPVSIANGNLLTIQGSTLPDQKDGDSIRKYQQGSTKTAESGTTTTTIKITNHGITIGDYCYIKNTNHGYQLQKAAATDANTLTLDGAVTGQTMGDGIQFFTYSGTQTAELGSATVYVDYVSLTATVNKMQDVGQQKLRFIGKNLANYNGSVILKAGQATATDFFPIKLPSNKFTFGLFKSGSLIAVNGNISLKLYDGAKMYIDTWPLTANSKQCDTSSYGSYQDKIRYAKISCTIDLTSDVSVDGIVVYDGTATITAYDAYTETSMYVPKSLKGATNSYDEFGNDGKNATRMSPPKILQASDVLGMDTSLTNIDYAYINKPADSLDTIANTTNKWTGNFVLEGYPEFTTSDFDNASHVGQTTSNRSSYYYQIGFPKNTTLDQAKIALTGKSLTYALLTEPKPQQYDAQPITAVPGGYVIAEPVIRDNAKYGTNIAIADTTKPIQSLVSVAKLVTQSNEEIVKVQVDISTCTVATDGLSFTSTALVNGDNVTYEYQYLGTLTQQPTINISVPYDLNSAIDGLIQNDSYLYNEAEILESAIALHAIDMTNHEIYVKANGSGNTYTATIDPVYAKNYYDGMTLKVKFPSASTGASTFNVNGWGALGIKNPDGTDFTNIKAGVYILVVDGSNFQCVGKGGGGTAIASHLLNGDTATVDSGQITGTMPNNSGKGNIATSISAIQTQLYMNAPAGYYDGTGSVYVTDVKFVKENIPNGMTMLGMTGNGANVKRKVSITKPSGTDAALVYDNNNNSSTIPYVSHGLLEFIPKKIVIKNATTNVIVTVYDADCVAPSGTYASNSKVLSISGNSITYFQVTGGIGIGMNFSLPVPAMSTNYLIECYE